MNDNDIELFINGFKHNEKRIVSQCLSNIGILLNCDEPPIELLLKLELPNKLLELLKNVYFYVII